MLKTELPIEEKKCSTTEYLRNYRKKNRDKINKQRRKWLAQKPHRYDRQAAKWARENRDKQLAYSRLYEALKKGTVVKTPCSCGNSEVIAFYNDYEDINSVEWLCRYCHRKRTDERKSGKVK